MNLRNIHELSKPQIQARVEFWERHRVWKRIYLPIQSQVRVQVRAQVRSRTCEEINR